jgi:Sec-independent protein translocase protein TatA
MTDVFSSMEYPHWLIVAGAILVVLGSIGFAFRQRKGAEATLKEMANESEQGRPEFEAELAQTQAASRNAKLAEQARDRWASKDVSEPPQGH